MITSIKKSGGASFTYEWTGVAPYRLYQSGVLLTDNTIGGTVLDGATTNSTSRVFQSTDKYEPPAIEVLDAEDGTAQSIANPPYAILQWRGMSNAYSYKVYEKVGSSWKQRNTYLENGQGYYKHATGVLADCTAHEWKVQAFDVEGGASGELKFDVFMVRNPDPPRINIAWSETTHKFTVSARA